MLVIRLRRVGKKNKPSYRIVVAEHSFPIDGRFVADLGFYNPHTKATGIDKDKAVEWMKKGAQPSNTIAKILVNEKVKHSSVVVEKKNKKPKTKSAEPKVAAPPQGQGDPEQSGGAVAAPAPEADAPIEPAETAETPETTNVDAPGAESVAEEIPSNEATPPGDPVEVTPPVEDRAA